MKFQKTVLTVLALVVWPAFAADEQWYQVEVIIFSQADSFSEETGRPNIKLGYPARHTDLDNDTTGTGLRRLDESAKQLKPDAYTLNKTGVYKVLYHEVWQQPGLAASNTPWLVIRGGKTIADHHELEGSIRLYLSNYLLFETNLWLTRTSPTIVAAQLPLPGLPANADATTTSYVTTEDLPRQPFTLTGDSPAVTAVAENIDRIYTLKQGERLKLGKLQYLDHPAMGVLIKVVRAPG